MENLPQTPHHYYPFPSIQVHFITKTKNNWKFSYIIWTNIYIYLFMVLQCFVELGYTSASNFWLRCTRNTISITILQRMWYTIELFDLLRFVVWQHFFSFCYRLRQLAFFFHWDTFQVNKLFSNSIASKLLRLSLEFLSMQWSAYAITFKFCCSTTAVVSMVAKPIYH